jgi:precorrin-2/cobalt-factor-2 C20-methyltransferase
MDQEGEMNMKLGTFYGIGVGPGDPELITVKGANLLKQCRHVFVPKARIASDSVALHIARNYLGASAQIHERVFPMTHNPEELTQRWQESAEAVAAVLETGDNACFLTIGDPLVYSTYIYLLRALRIRLPELNALTIPGITSFCAAASLTGFPLGEKKELITVVPTSDDLSHVRAALHRGGTVVLMKIAERLAEIIAILKETGTIDQAVFVARAGQEGQRVETNLRILNIEDARTGYLSLILVHATGRHTP